MTRHIVGLYAGFPGARKWRRYLTEQAIQPGATAAIIEEAAALVTDQAEAA